MKENTSPSKAMLTYGVVFGIALILELVILYALDLDPSEHQWVGALTNSLNFLIFPVMFVLLACIAYKKLNGGYISFGQCVKTGAGTMALGGLIYGLFYIIFNIVLPEFQDEMFEKMKVAMVKQNPEMTSEQMEMGLKMAKTFMSPYVSAPISILLYTFLGVIYSLIIGAIIKKENQGAFQQ